MHFLPLLVCVTVSTNATQQTVVTRLRPQTKLGCFANDLFPTRLAKSDRSYVGVDFLRMITDSSGLQVHDSCLEML